jgi:FSR family fosmidomycin resistance protein-like MFS transporter
MAALILLCLGHFVIDLYSSALGAFQPVLVARLPLSLAQAGTLGGILIFFSSVMQPLYGYLSDRFHTRLFTVLAPAVAGLICLASVVSGFWPLLFTVCLGGAGIAAFHPQGTAWAGRSRSDSPGRSMAVFISAGTLGMALGPTIFSSLIETFGFESVVWAAMPGVAVTGFLLLRLHGAPSQARQRSIDWDALRAVQAPLILHYFLVFLRSVVQITFMQFLPLYLMRERGLTLSSANHTLSLYLTAGALGGFLGGHLADRFGGRTVILISMIGSVPFLIAFFATTGIVSAAALFCAGFVLLFTIPVNVVMAQQLAPSQAGTVSALMMGFSWGMAGLIFVPLTGWLADSISLDRALSLLVLAPAAGFLLALRLPR